MPRNMYEIAWHLATRSSDLMNQTELNTWRMARAQEEMIGQLANLLDLNMEQLAVQHQQLRIQHEQLGVQYQQLATHEQQLYIQDQIRQVNQQQLVINEHQLIQAIRTVGRLDITNRHLAKIDASLHDLGGLLAQQNVLLQKSLNRLAAEAQELIMRGIEAYNNDWIEDAQKDFQAAAEKNPYVAICHYYLGKCYNRSGQADKATQAYHKCIYYARQNAPILFNLASCDLALQALNTTNVGEARQYLAQAQACVEVDHPILVSALLDCDIGENELRSETSQAIEKAFASENTDPEVLLEVLTLKASQCNKADVKKRLEAEKPKWEQLARKVKFQRLISHFCRELDDFVYLAPRVRRGFMEAASGQLLSLGEPLADILDWTATIGERLLKTVESFTTDELPILSLFRPLHIWNEVLVQIGKLVGVLAARSSIVSGQFVQRLNLAMLELPMQYADDRIIMEVSTDEGDSLALSCYYAIFTRNGVQHFSVPLREYSLLRLETYPARQGAKGVIVVDTRFGQTLVQGTTGSIEDDTGGEAYLIDLFAEAADVLCRIHEIVGWSIAHEEELFSIFLLLHAVADKLKSQRQGSSRSPRKSPPQAHLAPSPQKSDDGFEIVEEPPLAAAPVLDDGFEVIEEESPDKWYIARNKKRSGPFTWEQLKQMFATGQLQATDMLLQEGSKKWNAAGTLPGLMS